jgi:hypothetical protein
MYNYLFRDKFAFFPRCRESFALRCPSFPLDLVFWERAKLTLVPHCYATFCFLRKHKTPLRAWGWKENFFTHCCATCALVALRLWGLWIALPKKKMVA